MKIFKIFPVICAVFIWLLTASSCSNEIIPASEFVPYIDAYTGGLIYPSSNIRIELAKGQTSVKENTEVKEKLFSFSPSIKGKAYWVDNRTVEFVPETGALKSGQTYQAEFELGKVMKIDKRLKVFNFSFKVEEKDFDMQINPLDIVDPSLVSATGLIYLNFDADLDAVKKMFSVRINDNQTLSPTLENGGNARTFRFVVKDIQRKQTDGELKMTLNGKDLGVKKTISRTLTIPALDVFKVLSVELISESENGVRITFSYPVSTTQDLKGLISIPEIDHFTYQVQNNKILIYFEQKGIESITVDVDRGIKNTQGAKMDESFSTSLNILKLKPQVEILKSGNIIPTSGNLLLPFRAVNLNAVDLKIIKIFENNVLMFLQTNSLDGSNELRRAGRLVYKKTIHLDAKNPQDWQNYSIDLSGIVWQDAGAIYRIELSFRQEYSTYPCSDTDDRSVVGASGGNLRKTQSEEITEEDENFWDSPYSSYYDNYYDWNYYDWDERDNPCHPSYYMGSERNVSCNVIMSNIGVIAKSNSDNQWWIALSNILDTSPIGGADIVLYNYQLQTIGSAKTGSDGFAMLSPKGKPFVLIASASGQKTYLRLVEGEENSLSRFDVGGKTINKGIKGYIYGERGVWRPGDTLHVTFILNDPEKRIPENHPVSFELYNARGQFYSKQLLTKGVNGFYTYAVPTKDDDPTGLWNAYVKIGGTSFHKSFRIETIKPNRLKINLFLPGGDRIDAGLGSATALLTSSWLTGVVARSLKTKVEMTLTKTNTQFKGFDNYLFNNPASDFSTNELEIFDGALNESGEVKFNFKTPKAEDAQGMLNANIVCRVFEQGGDASIYTQNIPYSPFSSYVGINLNQPSDRYIETDTNHRFDVATVDADGKPVNRNNLEYKIYRLDWSWWWEQNSESFSTYVNGSSYEPVAQGNLKTVGGKTNFNFKLEYPNWGRYLVYVKDKDSGHATGGVVFIDWPDWRGRSNKSDPDNIKMLSFSTDKTSYEVGETVTVIIPASGGGTALLALENGSTILNRTWASLAEKGDTKYTFKATPEMAPNFYIHISLLQPHAQTVNDLPIRMYGVKPVGISNKESILNPQIDMPDVLRPETEFTVEVSEKSGKPMTYTLAIVDDGLLDLTNFKTPNPWSEFYAREALGIRTWDMFDYVMGAFAGKYSGMFSVGGDEDMKPANTKANRFKPVVKYMGPFTLNKSEKKKHKITLPVYVGSVRTMVVAGQNGAYGKAEKTTPVRTPLMILSSLPRVISANEEITLPVNVFAMENSVNDVSVKVETTGLLQVNGANSRSVRFSQPGDEMVYFPMKTGSKTGIEKVTVTATGGGKTSTETVEIDVRNPNPTVILSDNKLVNAGGSGEFSYRLTGTSTDDWVKLDVSRIPSIDFSRRFDFLYNYEHYCTEQLTSRALPLLFITQFKDVDVAESDAIKKNIREAIAKLYGRQLISGGIVYWPGQSSANEWVTSYAGCFLVLAKEKGYEVNADVLNRWKSYQRKEAQNWSPTASSSDSYFLKSSELQQAYRLYSLALSGAPELGAMNRLKETQNLSSQARWCLAAAYALSGKIKPAEELIFKISTTVESYYSSYTYGSSDRDEAMILQTLVLMGRLEEAFQQAQRLSQKMSQQKYYDTQSTAFILVAMGGLAEKTSGTIEFGWTLNGKKQDEVRSAKAAYQIQLSKNQSEGKIALTNQGKGILYVNVVSKSKPLNDTLPAIANNLRLKVSYTDLTGKSMNISEIKQGTDFIAVVEVTNLNNVNNYTDLALTHIIPSGWEIFNERMTGEENRAAVSDAYTYRDIRDDRVLTYFDLPKGATKTIKVRLQASYAGSFVLPAILCEAMYDTTAQARTKAGRVTVTR